MQSKVVTAAMMGTAGFAAALAATRTGSTQSSAVKVVSAGQAGGSTTAAAPPMAAAAAASSFTASSTDFPNPERGFYRWISPGYLDQWTQSDATDAYNNGYRILFARINLADYKTTDTLPTSYLNSLRTAFGYARSAGVKLIIRAVYNYPNSETDLSAGDAPLARIKTHINQLAPVLRDNGDVIAFVQAGFVGVWGEWHSSKNGFDDAHPEASNWAEVKDALLAAVPDTRFVQFRYPRHLMNWAPQSSLPTLDNAITNKFRLGFHNDCFLSGVADIGTYSDDANTRSNERAYADQLGDIAPVGGETCDSTWSSSNVRRTTCADILGEGAKYNFTYLNIDYWRPEFHDRWTSNGCMPDVRRKMGYRLALTSASHGNTVSRGSTLNVAFGVQNSGWARIYNDRLVQVVLQNVSSNAVQRITASGADPRKWTPGSTSNASVNAVVPSGLATGTYRVLLALPDKSATLTSNVKYAVRFANDNNSSANQYWDSALGAFALGTTVQVN